MSLYYLCNGEVEERKNLVGYGKELNLERVENDRTIENFQWLNNLFGGRRERKILVDEVDDMEKGEEKEVKRIGKRIGQLNPKELPRRRRESGITGFWNSIFG